MIRLSYIIVNRISSFSSEDQLHKVLVLAKESGYDGVEFNWVEKHGVNLDHLERWLDDLGLAISSLMTGEAYKEGMCFCSPDPTARQRTVERLISLMDTAHRFNAVLAVGLLQGLRSDEPDPDVANERIVAGLRQVAAAAEDKGAEIVMEPVNHLQVGFNNSVKEVRELVQRVGSPAVKPMADTLHMNIEETSLVQPILALGSELRHVHLCESNGSVFGSGHIDFGSVLHALDQINYPYFGSVKVYRGASVEVAARTAMHHLRASY